MMKYDDVIEAILDGGGHVGTAAHSFLGASLPSDHRELLARANGILTRDESLEVFTCEKIISWNKSEWKAEYGALAEKIIFVAQDCFGDQYGYTVSLSEPAPLVRFRCEGGETEVVEALNVAELIRRWLQRSEMPKFDWALFDEVSSLGHSLSEGRHFAFSLPLIGGGEYSAANVALEPAVLHLHVLGQMSRRNLSLADQTPIRSFN